jgi:MFS family permease
MSEAVITESVADPPSVPEPTSPGRARLELLIVGLGALMVSLAQSLLVPVLSILPERLNTSPSNVEWLLTSTLLVAAIAVPLFGRLGDMYGKRTLLLVALASLTIGSLVDAFTSNVGLLIAGRAIQGASAAAIPLGISLLSGLLPRDRVRSAIALISAMLGVGGSLGLPLAGVVAEHADFHVLFWITAAGGALSLLATATIVPKDTVRAGGRVDVPGVLLMSAALMALLLPLAQGSSWGWTSTRTVGLLAASVVLFVGFVLVEKRVRDPLVDLVATTRRPIVLTNIASLLFGFALFASLIGTASYVQAPAITGYGFGSSIVTAGLCLLPSGVLMLLLAPVAAHLIGAIGAHRTLSLGAIIVAVGWLVRIVFVGSIWEIVIGSAIVGAGTGIGYASMPALINTHTPVDELAAANGLNSLARSLGSTLASAIGGSLLTISTITIAGFALPSLSAYRVLFATCAGVAVLAAASALLIPQRSAATAE